MTPQILNAVGDANEPNHGVIVDALTALEKIHPMGFDYRDVSMPVHVFHGRADRLVSDTALGQEYDCFLVFDFLFLHIFFYLDPVFFPDIVLVGMELFGFFTLEKKKSFCDFSTSLLEHIVANFQTSVIFCTVFHPSTIRTITVLQELVMHYQYSYIVYS